MLIEKIERVDFHPLQRCFGNLLDMLRMAVEHIPFAAIGGIRFESKLGRNDDLSTKRGQRFADQFLIDERPIDLRRIEESDASSTAARITLMASVFSVGGP